MAKMDFANGTKESEIMRSFLIIMQKFFIPDESDEFWDEYLLTIDKFCKYYKDPICGYLSYGLTWYLDDKNSGKLMEVGK